LHKKIGSYIAWLAMKGAVGAASLLPLPVLFAAFGGLAAAARAAGIRRRVVRVNLSAAFGKDLTQRELDGIERDCYAEYGRIVSEIIASDRILRRKEENFEIVGLPILEEAIRGNKGLLLLTGHMGNFIVGAHCMQAMGFRMSVVAKRVANEYMNREIGKVYGRGAAVISVRGFKNDPQGGLKLYRGLKRGDVVNALIDQDAGPEGFRTVFFGLPTYLPPGPARFAHRAGVAVTTGFATREGGRIRIEIQPPIDYSSAGSPEEAEKIILDEYSRRLEETVRKCPEQYFWFHKKWKALPEIRARYEGRG